MKTITLDTSRLILRPWNEDDAPSLYRYACHPDIGSIAGWAPHTSIENSLEIIRTIFSAPETYAVVLKATGEPVGSVGIMFSDGMHSATMEQGDAEIGYWIGVPYWGQGLIPEAVRRLLRRCFEELNIQTVWCGYYDGNMKSCRVMQKCGFTFHHTETGKVSPLGDVRTEHFMRMTKEEWDKQQSIKIQYIKANKEHIISIHELIQATIKTIYPQYYPKDVVDFFCTHHCIENIETDINKGNVDILFVNNKIVGTGSCIGNHITRVYVIPQEQRKGYGSYIINQMENQIKKGYEHVCLESSLPAICMYEHMGYKTIRHEQIQVGTCTVLVYDVMEKCIRD